MSSALTPGSSAPLLRLTGAASLTSVELPGPCSDVSKVLDYLGGPARVAAMLDAHRERPNDVAAIPELRLRPADSFAHPVSGSIVESTNIVIKVTKRRNKRRRLDNGQSAEEGIFTVEHVGTINKTIRFRDILDYQYAAPMEDPVVYLSEGMRKLDFKSVADFAFPDPREEESDDLQLLPPPVFSRIALPQWYGYKKNPQTRVETTTNIRGEEVQRMRNTSRYSVVAPIAIAYTNGLVPTRPPTGIKEGAGTEQTLIARLTELLEERPVWTRLALFNHLSPDHHRTVLYNKQALPFLTYTFSDGPFRELVVRFGYDPRKEPTSRFYQRVQLRVAGERTSRSAKTSPVKSGSRLSTTTTEDIDRQSHLFDGLSLHTDIGTFQFCDLTDPLLQSLVHDPHFFRTSCHPVDGWYVADFVDHLRNILKQKFTALISGQPLSDVQLRADVERMQALPGEADGAPDAEDSEAGSRSEAGSEAVKGRKKRDGAAKKKKLKSRPQAKEPDLERALPDALRPVAVRDESEAA